VATRNPERLTFGPQRLAFARPCGHIARTMSATIHRLDAQRQPSLEPMVQLVAGDLNLVNAVILSRMQSEIPLIPELAGHLIAGGGKRMRPMLTLASARLLGYTGARHHRLAAAVEFIHTATCCTTMSSTDRTCAAASAPPTSSGAIRPACWSAISCSAARSS
jgi:hypothetical protein